MGIFVRRCLAVLLISACALAEDSSWLIDSDIRATVSALPRSWSGELYNKSTGVTFVDDTSFDSARWFAADYQARIGVGGARIAATMGAGVDRVEMADKADGLKTGIDGTGIHLDVGLAVHVAPHVDLEGSFLYGIGDAHERLRNADLRLTSDHGDYHMVGLLARAVVTLGPGVQFFAQAGYAGVDVYTKFDQDPAQSTAAFTVEDHFRGATYGAGAGWRF